MVRPEGLELSTFWFVASRPTFPNLARADASEAKSVSWDDPWQFTFSFTLLFLFANYHHLPRFASQFRDSWYSLRPGPNLPFFRKCHSGEFVSIRLLLSAIRYAANRMGSFAESSIPTVRLKNEFLQNDSCDALR